MGYIPEFVYFNRYQEVRYPFGIYWNHSYIEQSAIAIYNTFKTDINENKESVTLIARGSSGAIIAGAILSELKHINKDIYINILISRKPEDKAHGCSLEGLDYIYGTKLIVVDDFVDKGNTIINIIEDLDGYVKIIDKDDKHKRKYDMLCISNTLNAETLKKNYNRKSYRMWKDICSRFEFVACSPEYKKEENPFNNV